jgi:hypothetical protein
MDEPAGGCMPRDPAAKVTYSLRIQEHLRARLEVSAAKWDLSLNHEITRRLKNSLDQEEADLKRGERVENVRLMQIVVSMIGFLEDQRGSRWEEDPVLRGIIADVFTDTMEWAAGYKGAPTAEADKEKMESSKRFAAAMNKAFSIARET